MLRKSDRMAEVSESPPNVAYRYDKNLRDVLITKTYLYNFNTLIPHFYIVKLGFTGYTLFFLFLLKNIDCGYSLVPPRRGGSNEFYNLCF